MYDLIIIGAGAGGLFASAYAGYNFQNKRILVLEKTSKPGIKLLMSGSGQCNFTHAAMPEDFIMHYGENGRKIKHVIYSLNYLQLMDLMSKMGIASIIREDGKVFPQSLQATDIRDAFLHQASKNKTCFKYNEDIKEVVFQDSHYTIKTGSDSYQAKNILWATGGKSSLIKSFENNSYSLLQGLGHEVIPLKPALVPPELKNYIYGSLTGISFKDIQMSVISANKKARQFIGDMLFTHHGVSGPVVLDASRYFANGDILSFNFTTFKNYEAFYQDFQEKMQASPKKTIRNLLLEYALPEALINLLMDNLGIDRLLNSHNIRKENLVKLLKKLTDFDLEIKNLGSWQKAMVTSGGVSLRDINTKTMESKLYPGMYFAGEILDIDGDTGGYNIHFAMASAKLAIGNIFKK
ncbi:MAG TPA: aminoacetone oxidase family FAD-binding enzyme [Candidatus Cloacimonadota bacterium]|nr:aminoacetone oxidase family FAD-binding enzyme [Candidatus Cloacimonadota bacterium]